MDIAAVMLNVEKGTPGVVLDLEAIQEEAVAALRQCPERFAGLEMVDVVAREDGSLALRTADGSELTWPLDAAAPVAAAPAPAAAEPAAPPRPLGPAPVAPRPLGPANAARAYGAAAARPGGTGRLDPREAQQAQAVAAAENKALRHYLATNQVKFHAEYQMLLQAIRNNDGAAIQRLRVRFAAALDQDPEVQKARAAQQPPPGGRA